MSFEAADLPRDLSLRRVATLATVLATLVTLGLAAGRAAPEALEVGRFSASRAGDGLPADWQPLRFRNIERETTYSLVEQAGVTVVRAESQASASGLIRSVEVDLATHPILEWRWKIDHVLARSDVHAKAGDDNPARVYVAFEFEPERVGLWERARFEAARLFFGEYPPTRAINYIWATSAPAEAILPNAYSDRVRMIVVKSGDERVGEWILETRNVYDDFVRAYGEVPPRVTGIAIMTDTDDTGDAAVAWYGDLRFRKRSGEDRGTPDDGRNRR